MFGVIRVFRWIGIKLVKIGDIDACRMDNRVADDGFRVDDDGEFGEVLFDRLVLRDLEMDLAGLRFIILPIDHIDRAGIGIAKLPGLFQDERQQFVGVMDAAQCLGHFEDVLDGIVGALHITAGRFG